MLQENPDETILLDVRPELIYKSEHIPGAVNIPMGELESRLDELDKSKSAKRESRPVEGGDGLSDKGAQ